MEEDAGKMSTPVHTLSPLSHKQQQLREGHDFVESAMGARGSAVSGNNGVGVNYNFLDDSLVHHRTVLVPAGFTNKQGRGFGVQCPTTGTFTRGPPAGARHKLPNGACHPGEQMKHPPCLWLNSAVISRKMKCKPANNVHRFVVRFGEGSAASEVDAVGFALGGAHQLEQQLAAFYFGRDRVRTAATETRMKNKPPFVGITLSRAGDLIIRKADNLERREVWSLDWYKQIVAHAGEPVFIVDVDLARRELAFGLFLQQGKEMQKAGGNTHEDSECGGPSCRPLEPAMGGLRLGRDDRMKSGHQDDVLAGLGPQVAFESVAWGAGQPGWQSSSIALDRGALVASLKNGGASVRIINHVEIDRETATRSLGATRFWNGGVARKPEAFLSAVANCIPSCEYHTS
eukprot:g10385.t1